MKKHTLFPFLRRRMCNRLLAMSLATALGLAGCSTDDDRMAGDSLPEGKYPLTFTATQADAIDTASPQTRVSDPDGTSSQWDGDEQISVQIGDATETGTYTLNAGGTIKTPDKPVYWQSTAPQTVTAWYSNISGQSTTINNTVSLDDQRSGLAYVMKATASNVAYNTSVSLNFQHQLAKVRVKLTGEKANDVTSVTIKNYTSCTVNNGDVTPGEVGNIAMHKATYGGTEYWEANVVPQSVSDLSDFIQLNGTVKATVSPGITTLEAGKMYTIELKVNKKVNFDISADEVNITDDDAYTVTGTGTKTIIINGSPTVTLRDVAITAETAIRIDGGTPTIVLEGENRFIANGASSVISLANEDAHVIIEGNNSGRLFIQQSNGVNPNNDAIIGGAINSAAGNITIQNATLTIDCSEARAINAAIIGSGEAYAGTGAISASSCGNIVISNTNLTITAKLLIGACIGTGVAVNEAQSSCGAITITLKEGTQKDFLEKLTVAQHTADYLTLQPNKVGTGGTMTGGTSICGTVAWNNPPAN